MEAGMRVSFFDSVEQRRMTGAVLAAYELSPPLFREPRTFVNVQTDDGFWVPLVPTENLLVL